ncbi:MULTISPECIES: GNAT family N-acetyltransferase [Halomonas]|uniref:GNAT family N-acetyltransferase n=1 Tax=Halomonas TaxID=2745 RepID=UPI001554424D|nr:GNAT family N-acetyltransferase [Halomonas hibernica]
MQLIRPNVEYEQSYRTYIQELGDEERYPFPLDFDHTDFKGLLAKLETFRNGTDLPEGVVPSSTYWLVGKKELLGVSNLRHHLNDRIRHVGGHVGLGIRPSQRGGGLGNQLLALTLSKAFERGIHPVHIHCYKHNVASSKIIIANGGCLESEINDGGKVVQRYAANTPW